MRYLFIVSVLLPIDDGQLASGLLKQTIVKAKECTAVDADISQTFSVHLKRLTKEYQYKSKLN